MGRVELSDIDGVVQYSGKASNDLRGAFTKYFDREAPQIHGFDPLINSLSVATNINAGTIRGLHFQTPPFEEEKVIICLQGRIFDVIVDLRRNSPTLGKWAGIELDGEIPASLCLPKGIAHGYQTLTPNTNVFYALSSQLNQEHAHSLNYADVDLEISWPMPVAQISAKDSAGISLHDAMALFQGRP